MADYNHLDEFFDLHRQEVENPLIPKTSLFSEYVAYCNQRDYKHHTNLVHFSKAVKVKIQPTHH